jgi:hypothetical protein
MGKYLPSDYRRRVSAPKGPHPIWNTVGCLMLVLVPVMAIALAILTVQLGLDGRWPIPPEFLRPIYLPDWIYLMPGLAYLLTRVVSVDYLIAYAVFAIFYIVLLSGLMSFIYAVMHRLVAPSRLGPLDVAPIKHKPLKQRKNYKR